MLIRRIFSLYGGTLHLPSSTVFSSSQSCLQCFRFQRYSSILTNGNVTVSRVEEDENSSEEIPKKPLKKKSRKRKTVILDAAETDSEKKANGVSFSKLTSTGKTIAKYIDELNGQIDLWKNFSRHDLKQLKTVPKSVYLVSPQEAVKIGEAIKSENPDLLSPVLELHAGLGLLTNELIHNIGFKFVTCMESYGELRKRLTERFDVSLIELTWDALPRYHHLDKIDGGERIHSMLDKIRHHPEERNHQLYVIGALPSISSINFLIRNLVTKRIFFEDDTPWNGVTMFVAFGSKVHLICTATPEDGLIAYRASTVLFQTLFKYKEIAVVPRKAFIPWEYGWNNEVRKGPRKLKLQVKDSENLHIYKIEVNQDTVQKVGKDNLFSFFYFVRQHLFARKNRIIPELEKWIPGCGIRLIKQGFDIFSQIGVLQPEQILDLYLQFVSWPEFANSSFSNAVEKYQTRVEIVEEDEEELGVVKTVHTDFQSSRKKS